MMHTIRFFSLVLAIGSALPVFSDAIPDWKDQMAHVLAFDDGEMEYFGNSWYVLFSDLGFSDVAMAVPHINIYSDGCLWGFLSKNCEHRQVVGTSVWARFKDVYSLKMDNVQTPVIYKRLKSPVNANGDYRTWAEYEKGIDGIVITNELLQVISVDSNGIPRIDTIPENLISRLWTDSFQSLEKMNFDIYSGTNLTHSMLFPDSTAPEAPELTAAEKDAFASWFRSCAATNGVPSTNAVLSVFADDDFDGRMDAFAALDAPPDADGSRRWAFCWNTGEGWLFFGLDAPSSVTARTNEFFRVIFNGNDNGIVPAHGVVVIRPNPENPVHPLLPRHSDEPMPNPADWPPPSYHFRRFIADYDEFFDLYEYRFFRLERLPVENIP